MEIVSSKVAELRMSVGNRHSGNNGCYLTRSLHRFANADSYASRIDHTYEELRSLQ